MALEFIKAGVAVSSTIAKETILSKIINTISMFSIDLADRNFDDTQKKYVHTILKLDDSKTIMLETRGGNIVVKNMKKLSFQEGDEIYLEYSSILEDEGTTLFINYTELDDIPLQTVLKFVDNALKFQLVSRNNEIYKLRCITSGDIVTGQKIVFEGYEAKVSFLSERDKKNIVWGIQSGVNILSAGSIRSAANVEDIRNFLIKNEGAGMKLFARISQKMFSTLELNIPALVDGVVINHNDWTSLEQEFEFISSIKHIGKPVIVVLNEHDILDRKGLTTMLQQYITLGVDIISLSEQVLSGNVNSLDIIQDTFLLLDELENTIDYLPEKRFIHNKDAHGVLDENAYLINLLPQLIEETHAKMVLCYTAYGYTAAKLSSLGLTVPVLVFTRDDFSYRYNNLLRGVKGYKISQTSNYKIFKQLGKEMIRIYFKGNISLDDKILIINIREGEKEEMLSGLINGIELYKFKNI